MLHAHHLAKLAMHYGDPSFRNFVVTSAAIALAVMVSRLEDKCYIEFPEGEPMVNVIDAIRLSERYHSVAFDPDDPDLWEQIPGGYRLHGMFREELT